ncbi:MAG: hypothetical protein HKO76_02795, partial [Acidimicrobiia bacterium]|nr:hypothetical protein [Acidimicrobiia bacterium]
MPAPLSHRDVGRLVGTWPSALTTSGLAIAPNALSLEATILGVVRETAAGFDVIGRSIDIWVDSQPAAITVSFTTTGSSTLTLDEVIAQINATVSPLTGSDLAYRDNGFLRLRSATSGTGSYIRLQTDPASSPMDVFANLG